MTEEWLLSSKVISFSVSGALPLFFLIEDILFIFLFDLKLEQLYHSGCQLIIYSLSEQIRDHHPFPLFALSPSCPSLSGVGLRRTPAIHQQKYYNNQLYVEEVLI